MPVILFVHGTGVRAESYFRTLDLIYKKARLFLPNWTIKGCQWGDPFGARLNRNGESIPGYSESGSTAPAIEDAELARWYLLAGDPLLELRLLPDEVGIGRIAAGPRIWELLPMLAVDVQVAKLLEPWGVCSEFEPFIEILTADLEWKTIVSGIAQSAAAAWDKVARAVVAAFQIHLRERVYPGLTGKQRDLLRVAFLQPLGGPPLGVGDWFLRRLTNFGLPRRGRMSDSSSPSVGDILRYQARGAEIRNFIEHEIRGFVAKFSSTDSAQHEWSVVNLLRR